MARTKRFMALPQPIAIVSTGQSRSFVAMPGVEVETETPFASPTSFRNHNRHRYRLYLVLVRGPIVLPSGELQCLRRMPRLILRKMSAEQPPEWFIMVPQGVVACAYMQMNGYRGASGGVWVKGPSGTLGPLHPHGESIIDCQRPRFALVGGVYVMLPTPSGPTNWFIAPKLILSQHINIYCTIWDGDYEVVQSGTLTFCSDFCHESAFWIIFIFGFARSFLFALKLLPWINELLKRAEYKSLANESVQTICGHWGGMMVYPMVPWSTHPPGICCFI